MSDASRNQSYKTKPAPAQTAHRTVEKVVPKVEARATGQPIALKETATATASRKAPGLEMEEAIVTAGRTGELNITIEKFWVEVNGHLPAGFNVTTREGHGLDVLLEQLVYKRTYTGTSALKTGLTPLAPIGTRGRILVTDTTTGETLEQPWTWRPRGGGFSFWQRIKRLIWKG
jgi:hypothetical protein